MNHSRRNATLFGAVGGASIALTLFAILIGRLGLHTVVGVDGQAIVEMTSGALYLVVLIVSSLAGLFIGAIGYGVSVSAAPDSPRFSLRYLLPVSAFTTAVVAYAILRIGVGGFGTISDGVVTVGVLRMTLTVLAIGTAAGGAAAGISDALARPEVFAFGGQAWPTSSRQVMRAMADAVSAPLIAIVAAAAFAITLSIVLIELEGDAATVVFAVVGAIVLGVTAVAAARPWDKEGASDS